ncbi:MAG: hypothetical protein ABIH25_02445 [Candidatus Woesearchaeota archaeon]
MVKNLEDISNEEICEKLKNIKDKISCFGGFRIVSKYFKNSSYCNVLSRAIRRLNSMPNNSIYNGYSKKGIDGIKSLGVGGPAAAGIIEDILLGETKTKIIKKIEKGKYSEYRT